MTSLLHRRIRLDTEAPVDDYDYNNSNNYAELCQSARMSKITNDGLTPSDTGCSIAVPIWQQWALKG